MEGGVDEARLRRLLGGEHTAWLLDRMRRRLTLGKPLTGTVTLATADLDQRRAMERLLGRRAGTGTSLTVSLDEVDTVLRASGAAAGGLTAAAQVLLGAVPDRVAEAAAEAAAWSAACAPLDALVERRPELAPWRAWLDVTGLLRRLAGTPANATVLVESLVRVLDMLPAKGFALGRLAAETTGDAHALDDGRPLSTLSLGAVRAMAGAPPAGDGSAFERRAAWAAVGVHRDELSSTVLCVGLPGGGATTVGRTVALAREAGEPCVLTLRQLGRDRPDLGVGTGLVRVCENPIVLACAADELGAECPPLVCLGGHPSAAALRVLELLTADGADLAYHGDFDWGGIRIANALRERFAWQPWRFDALAYRSALAVVTGGALTGRPVDASWDPGLRPAFEQHDTHIQEELVLPDLMADLAG
ncbi:TIGR02679 family protein [Actinophytocola sp.]|uniref:TIGR02679 family protein n=1 Tax=Actinophytocola sp. TaxID=1872138 RepID=UPI002ED21B39